MRFTVLLTIFLLGGVCLSAVPANAQVSREVALLCVKRLYASAEEKPQGDVIPAIAQSEADRMVKTVMRKIGMRRPVRTIACELVDNAAALRSFESEGPPEQIGDYILYDPTWMRAVAGRKKVHAIFILGHELGHILHGHLTDRRGNLRLEQETEADYAGGCAVGRTYPSEWLAVEDLIYQIRDEEDGDYPSIRKSTDAAKAGYEDCGGILADDNSDTQAEPMQKLTDSEYSNIRVLYFKKDMDGQSVIDVLVSLGIEYEIGRSQTHHQTDLLTCTDDFPFEKFRKLALALYDNGVRPKVVNLALARLNARNRISIEYENIADRQPLSRKQLENMDRCRWYGGRPT